MGKIVALRATLGSCYSSGSVECGSGSARQESLRFWFRKGQQRVESRNVEVQLILARNHEGKSGQVKGDMRSQNAVPLSRAGAMAPASYSYILHV